MWGPLAGAWLEHPIGGWGPGSFPWALQTTGYFDANAWAPRHPDSKPIPAPPRGGSSGLIGRKPASPSGSSPRSGVGRSTAAQWASARIRCGRHRREPDGLRLSSLSSLSHGRAFAAPREPSATREGSQIPRWPRYAALAMLAVIGVGYASTMVASFAYASAASSVRRYDPRSAEAALNTAVGFDPGMALYARQRGTNRLLLGELSAATQGPGACCSTESKRRPCMANSCPCPFRSR